MKSELSSDEPKSLGSPEARAARLAGLGDSHIVRLTAFVDVLRAEMGSDYRIPYFDPSDGGIGAEVLFLLEAPGAKAVESGFISRNNPDETAKNFFQISQQARIPRRRTITWNIVPWYIGSGSRIRAATSADIEMGFRRLHEVLELLPKLRAVGTGGAESSTRFNPNCHVASQCQVVHVAPSQPVIRQQLPGQPREDTFRVSATGGVFGCRWR